jgi:phage gpG-like protein
MFGLTLKAAKSRFFDRKSVIDAMDKKTHAFLSRFGAFVRTRSKTSIRMRKHPSAPGRPPHGHKSAMRKKTNRRTGVTKVQAVSLLKEYITFSYDPFKKSVVIGPPKLSGPRGGPPALKALEYGGKSTVLAGRKRKPKKVTIRARPFMRPAFNEEIRRLPANWQQSVR